MSTEQERQEQQDDAASLAKLQLEVSKTHTGPNINGPISSTDEPAAFPQEYEVETDAGLVRQKTIQELHKIQTGEDIQANEEQVNKLSKQVERNKKDIENYEKHKHEKNFFKKLFYKIVD